MSCARGPAEENGVESAEEARWRELCGTWSFLQVDERAPVLFELGCDCGQAGPGVSKWEARPLGQVPVVRWAMTREVAACQLRQRLVTINRGSVAKPVPGEDVRVLLAHHRSADEHPAEGGEPDDVRQRLAFGGHLRRLQAFPDLLARQRAFLRQRALDDGHTPIRGARFNAQLRETVRVGRQERRCRQHVQPRIVLAPDEVQRAPVQPGDDERPIDRQGAVDIGCGQAFRPGANGEASPAGVLTLDG